MHPSTTNAIFAILCTVCTFQLLQPLQPSADREKRPKYIQYGVPSASFMHDSISKPSLMAGNSHPLSTSLPTHFQISIPLPSHIYSLAAHFPALLLATAIPPMHDSCDSPKCIYTASYSPAYTHTMARLCHYGRSLIMFDILYFVLTNKLAGDFIPEASKERSRAHDI